MEPLGVLVYGAVRRNGLDMSLPTLFLGILVYNVVLGVVIYVSFGAAVLLQLGTGMPAPSLKRQSSGYLIEVGGSCIVMDHGSSCPSP